MTLKEIAKLAGVSPSTVSRVVNSPDGSFGTKEVQERIWALVHEHGYTVNKSAQQLRQGDKQPKRINSGIACIYGRTQSAFLKDLGRFVEYQGMAMGYPVITTFCMEDIQSKAMFDALSVAPVAGAIVIGHPTETMTEYIKKRYAHVVYLGMHPGDSQWDQVICSAYSIAKEAVNFLQQQGHTKIAYIGKTDDDLRYAAYCDAMQAQGANQSYYFTRQSGSDPAACYQAAKDLIERNATDLPSAVFCANDNTSIAVMKAFQENGLRIPRDISVVSAQNLEIAQYSSPTLTSVNIPSKQMGIMGVKLLVERITNQKDLPIVVNYPHKLIIRESVASV